MTRRAILVALALATAGTSLSLAASAEALPPPAAIVTGLDAGWPDVRGWERNGTPARQWAPWGEWPIAFSPYPTYAEGVRVAVGDVDGDGRMEIVTAPGKSAFTELKVFDGQTFRQERTLLPFKDAAWWAGAYVATGDTNGDGRDEVVDGLDAGCCTTLHVLDALSGNELSGFFPYGNSSEVGARVAAADFSGDGKAEIVAVPLGSARISLYPAEGGAAFRSFDAFGTEAAGLVSVAAGNLIGDPRPEVIAAVPTPSGAEVKIVDPVTGAARSVLYPYGGAPVTGLAVALGDVDGGGTNDLVLAAATPSGTEVKAIAADGTPLAGFFVVDPAIRPGASVAAGDLDGDGKAEIVLGGGATTAPWPPVANGPEQRVAVYEADGTQTAGFAAYPGLFQGGVRVALADLTGDRRPEMVTAPGPGLQSEIAVFSQQWVNGRDRGTRLGNFLAFEPEFVGGATVATGDVDRDGDVDIVVGAGNGRLGEVRVFDAQGRRLFSFLPFGSGYHGGISVATGDLDADGRAEIVVGTLESPARVRVFDGIVAEGPVITPFAAGVQVGVADVAGVARGLIVAGETSGTQPRLSLIDPEHGSVVRSVRLDAYPLSGIRVSAGDLDGDGRDEILLASGFGGDSRMHVFDGSLAERTSFAAYSWSGAGMNIAVASRIGFPIAAQSRVVRLKARKRSQALVAQFRDAGGGAIRMRASIAWGDGTSSTGVVLVRGGGVYDVRGKKRYVRPGRYSITVTLSDQGGRMSVARSTASVRR